MREHQARPDRLIDLRGGIEGTVKRALFPWSARHMYLNFADTGRDPGTFWSEDAYRRLRRIKARIDPHELLRANHPITPLFDDAAA